VGAALCFEKSDSRTAAAPFRAAKTSRDGCAAHCTFAHACTHHRLRLPLRMPPLPQHHLPSCACAHCQAPARTIILSSAACLPTLHLPSALTLPCAPGAAAHPAPPYHHLQASTPKQRSGALRSRTPAVVHALVPSRVLRGAQAARRTSSGSAAFPTSDAPLFPTPPECRYRARAALPTMTLTAATRRYVVDGYGMPLSRWDKTLAGYHLPAALKQYANMVLARRLATSPPCHHA